MGPQGMWAFLPGPVWGRGGADAGDQVCKGGVAASGGESFPGSRSAPDLFVFSHLDFFV